MRKVQVLPKYRLDRQMPIILRWGLLPIVVCLAFAVAVVVGLIAGGVLQLWGDPIVGFFAAISVVLVAYQQAPSRKRTAATFAFIVGACIAWWLVSPPSFYPKNYGDAAYLPTYLPITATYIGGLGAWIGCLWWHTSRVPGRHVVETGGRYGLTSLDGWKSQIMGAMPTSRSRVGMRAVWRRPELIKPDGNATGRNHGPEVSLSPTLQRVRHLHGDPAARYRHGTRCDRG